jgi:hypothetical protein
MNLLSLVSSWLDINYQITTKMLQPVTMVFCKIILQTKQALSRSSASKQKQKPNTEKRARITRHQLCSLPTPTTAPYSSTTTLVSAENHVQYFLRSTVYYSIIRSGILLANGPCLDSKIHPQISLCKKKIPHHIKMSAHIWSIKCRWNKKTNCTVLLYFARRTFRA